MNGNSVDKCAETVFTVDMTTKRIKIDALTTYDRIVYGSRTWNVEAIRHRTPDHVDITLHPVVADCDPTVLRFALNETIEVAEPMTSTDLPSVRFAGRRDVTAAEAVMVVQRGDQYDVQMFHPHGGSVYVGTFGLADLAKSVAADLNSTIAAWARYSVEHAQ